jgi:hypothetical protein
MLLSVFAVLCMAFAILGALYALCNPGEYNTNFAGGMLVVYGLIATIAICAFAEAVELWRA